jgi:hypothetical protein
MITRITLLTLTLALFTGACTDDKNDSATDSTGSSGSSESGDTTGSEPTTTMVDPGTTGSASTTGSEPGDTGAEPTTGEPTTGAVDPSTTGEAPPELLPECTAMCDKAVECGLAPENDGCAIGCSEQYASDTAECAGLASDYLGCMAGLSCAELFQEGICADAEAKWTDACTQFDTCGVGWGGGADECSLEIDCAEEPLREMKCDTETCTCLVGGQAMGSCAAEAICEDLEALEAKGASCCGF